MEANPDNGNGQAKPDTMSGCCQGRETVHELRAKLLLSKADVARLLSVPESSILSLHRCGALEGLKVSGHLCWRPGDVERFVEGLEREG